VKSVKLGAVMAEVVVELADGQEIVSAITRTSAESLNLKQGKVKVFCFLGVTVPPWAQRIRCAVEALSVKIRVSCVISLDMGFP